MEELRSMTRSLAEAKVMIDTRCLSVPALPACSCSYEPAVKKKKCLSECLALYINSYPF